mgnify:FL=1
MSDSAPVYTEEKISGKLSEMPVEALVRLNQNLGTQVDALREQRRVLKAMIEQRLRVEYADPKDLEIQRLKLLLVERGASADDLIAAGDAIAPGVVLEAKAKA